MRRNLIIIFFALIMLTLLNKWICFDKNTNLEILLARDFMPNKPMIKVFSPYNENEWNVDIVDIVTENKMQVRNINNKLNQLHVYSLNENEVSLVYLDFEVALFAESYINEKPEMKIITLKGPIKKGTIWESENYLFEITDTNIEIKTPAGVFDAIEVTLKSKVNNSEEPFHPKQYFAKGIGIVKVIDKNYSSELIKVDYESNKLKGLSDVFEYLKNI